jgi:hypothetical protein
MIFSCTSTESVGCTFLDWSIHFITGQSRFYNIKQGWQPLSNNPVTVTNAHGHNKNHPSGFERTKYAINQLLPLHQDKLTSIYSFPLHLDAVANNLKISIEEISQPHNQKSISQYRTADYNQLLSYIATQSQVIFVSSGDNLNFYHQIVRSIDRMPLSAAPAESSAEIQDELDRSFFGDSIASWNNQNLTDIWDIRERKALQSNLTKSNFGVGELQVDFSFPHYWMDCVNWWFDGIVMIQEIVAWLKLKVDSDRFQEWIPIYYSWQKIQAKNLRFQWQYKHIIDCIINNWSYPIDLTFDEEIFIQHCLIYQHNLNLKTWQLIKFPNNTQELHKLLEPNIHTV